VNGQVQELRMPGAFDGLRDHLLLLVMMMMLLKLVMF
jgi:hypothetical protein